MEELALITQTLEYVRGRQVPDEVRWLYKQAAAVAARMQDYPGAIYWNANTNQAWPAPDNEQRPEGPGWIRIKRAGIADVVRAPFELGGTMTGGPSPLSTTIVGGLLGGGLGYGSGALLEHLFPERYVERGRLRKTLGLAGAGLGAIPGIWTNSINRGNAAGAGKPMGWESWTTPHERVPIDPHVMAAIDQQERGEVPAPSAAEQILDKTSGLPEPHPQFMKLADGYADSAGGFDLLSIPVDAFNQAIWNDVDKGFNSTNNPFGTKDRWGDNSQSLHTPPRDAAAISGLVTGVQEMYGRPSLLSPVHFIKGLGAAGVDLATAKLVGSTLGALGGLSPMAQDKLQDIGVWGGLIRGAVGSIFGL